VRLDPRRNEPPRLCEIAHPRRCEHVVAVLALKSRQSRRLIRR
jgi:hypothetical protein